MKNTSTIRRHLQAGRIADLRLSELTRGRIEAFLDEKAREGLAPQTVNHLRAYLSRAFSAAIERERWTGANPVRDTKARHGPKRRPDFLRFEEVGPVLSEVPPQHLRLFVTTLYTGLRKGELRALRKVDVDWSLRAIWVRRSGQRDTTKGGHEEPIPIHPDLEPVLRAAVDASPSELVFPGSDGKMLRDDFKFAAILRRAMARAGIVEGYLHVCRRKGCRYREQAADGAARRCPDHGMRLWPKPLVRKITFHHLRHTTASLFLMSGVPLEVVQRMLRHTDLKVTSGVYGHLLMGYQREAIARARLLPPALLGASAAGAQEPAPSVRTCTPLADMLLTGPGSGKKKAGTPVEKPEGVPACELERETGFEPATLSLGMWLGAETHARMGRKRGVAAGSVPLNPVRLGQTLPGPCPWRPWERTTLGVLHAKQHVGQVGDGVHVVRFAGRDEGVEAGLVLAGLIVAHEGAQGCRAGRLGVSTATVYKLCARSDLAHVRVLNALRIPLAARAVFTTCGGSRG